MSEELKRFFSRERQRVFEPGPYFTQRVMARLKDQTAETGIWENVLSATRPVVTLVLVLFLAFITIQVFSPVKPTRSMIDAYLSADQTTEETYLFSDSDDIDGSPELFEQLIVLEGGSE